MNSMNVSEPLSLDRWNEPLTPEERTELIDKIATAITRRGLQIPALFALEMHRPLGFIASQSLIALTPFLGSLVGAEPLQRLGRLLADPEGIDVLIARLSGPQDLSPPAPLPGTPWVGAREGGVDTEGGSGATASLSTEGASGSPSLAPQERGLGGEVPNAGETTSGEEKG